MQQSIKFTRDQLVFVVEIAMASAFEPIANSLPPIVPIQEYQTRQAEMEHHKLGCIQTFGMFIPILFAQLTDNGLASGDFQGFNVFQRRIENYYNNVMNRSLLNNLPDFRSDAENLVNDLFSDYVK